MLAGPAARLALATLLAAPLAGCTIVETEPGVGVVLLSPSPTREADLRLRVRTGVGDEARVFVDGVERGQVPVGDPTSLPIPALADGEHSIRAEVLDQGRTLRSGLITFVVDRSPPAFLSATPDPGPVPAVDPLSGTFTVVLEFGEPVLDWHPTSVTGSSFLSRSSDRRKLSYAVRAVAAGGGGFTAQLVTRAVDYAGNVTAIDLRWVSEPLAFTLLSPDLTRPQTGVITLRATFAAPSMTVKLDGIARDVLTTGEGLDLDTRSVADGLHELRFDAAGYLPVVLTLWVDNSSPVLLSCGPEDVDGRRHPADDAWVGDFVFARFNEAISATGAAPYLGALQLGGHFTASELPELPYTFPGEIPQVSDIAGHVLPASPCPVTFPVFNRPVGDGPLSSLAGATQAWAITEGPGYVEIAFVRVNTPERTSLFLTFEPDWKGAAGTLDPPGTTVTHTRGRAGEVGWVQRHLDGSGLDVSVYFRRSLMEVYTIPALPASLEPLRVEATGASAIAWTQAGAGGARELRAGWFTTGPAPRAPDATFVVSTGAVGVPGGAAIVDEPANVFWVETGAGHPAWLLERDRSAAAPDGLTAPAGPFNRDPAVAASEPAAHSLTSTDLLAWVEGGQVLVRVRAAGGAFGAPTVLNVDQARSASAPAFVATAGGPVLTFLEDAPGGTRIESRRFLETGPGVGTWVALPSLAPGGTVLEVSAPWPGLLWRDDAGDVRFRRRNE